MAVLTEKVTVYRCEGCGHKWQPRLGKAPKVCPVCKRTDWKDKRKAS
jgi:rubrerythrin